MAAKCEGFVFHLLFSPLITQTPLSSFSISLPRSYTVAIKKKKNNLCDSLRGCTSHRIYYVLPDATNNIEYNFNFTGKSYQNIFPQAYFSFSTPSILAFSSRYAIFKKKVKEPVEESMNTECPFNVINHERPPRKFLPLLWILSNIFFSLSFFMYFFIYFHFFSRLCSIFFLHSMKHLEKRKLMLVSQFIKKKNF